MWVRIRARVSVRAPNPNSNPAPQRLPQTSWGQLSPAVGPTAACQAAAPAPAPVASCGKCREPLFGATPA